MSNRNDSSFRDGNASAPADSLASFDIAPDGSLAFTGLTSAGGVFPRHFSINRAGDLVAVGLQWSGKVVLIARDVQTGKMGDGVAEVGGLGNVTSVIWDERAGSYLV